MTNDRDDDQEETELCEFIERAKAGEFDADPASRQPPVSPVRSSRLTNKHALASDEARRREGLYVDIDRRSSD